MVGPIRSIAPLAIKKRPRALRSITAVCTACAYEDYFNRSGRPCEKCGAEVTLRDDTMEPAPAPDARAAVIAEDEADERKEWREDDDSWNCGVVRGKGW